MRSEFAHAVYGARVESGGVGLRLQAYADVFDRAGDDAVGDAGKGASEIVLAVGEVGRSGGERRGAGCVQSFELAACVVEGAELNGDLTRSGGFAGRTGVRRTQAPIPMRGVSVPWI